MLEPKTVQNNTITDLTTIQLVKINLIPF